MKKLLLLSALLFSGCMTSTKQLPTPYATLDVYLTEEGFMVFVEQGTDKALAIRLNVTATHETE